MFCFQVVKALMPIMALLPISFSFRQTPMSTGRIATSIRGTDTHEKEVTCSLSMKSMILSEALENGLVSSKKSVTQEHKNRGRGFNADINSERNGIHSIYFWFFFSYLKIRTHYFLVISCHCCSDKSNEEMNELSEIEK